MADIVFVQGLDLAAERVYPPAHLGRVVARDIWRGVIEAKVETPLTRRFPQREYVGMSSIAQEAGCCRLALDQGVGRNRGAVDDAIATLEKAPYVDAVVVGGEAERIHEALLEAAGRGRRLEDTQSASGVGNDTVGEGAPDIDADRVAHDRAVQPPTRARRRAVSSSSST